MDMPTVMLVDDTEPARSALSRLLQREGYETVCASNGREALQSLAAMDKVDDGAGRPDLILLDVCMPELDGLAFLEVLQGNARWRDLPVIMLTGESDYHCVRRAEQLGAKHYLVKATFSVHEMLEHVERYTRHLRN